MTTTPHMVDRLTADVLAVQRILDSAVPHEDVDVWTRTREERLIALVHELTTRYDPTVVLAVVDRVQRGLEDGSVRTAQQLHEAIAASA